LRIRIALLVGFGLGILWAGTALAGVPVLEALRAFLQGSFGSGAAFGGTLRETTPLLLGGVAVYVALRCGLFNIGVEGQLVFGAVCCAAVALRWPGPLGALLGVLCAMGAGAAWAWPAGWIKAYRNGHEVITTIMLNSVAGLLTTALAAGPLRDRTQEAPSTASLAASCMLPSWSLGGMAVNSGTLLGLLAVAGAWWWIRRSVVGFEWSLTGANPFAAKWAGVRTKRVIVSSMCLSGAIAGLAGAVQVLAFEGRFYSGMSPGYGFDALGVALLAGGSGLGLIPSALLFGALAKGSTSAQILGVPKGISYLVLAILILVAAALRYRRDAGDD